MGEKRNELRHGFGTYVYKTNSFCVKYEGEWKDGEKNGKGRLEFADGSVYDGEFKAGEISGVGTRNFKNDRSYTGEFLLGEFHGEGIYMDSNVTYEGSFKRNKFDGKGKLFDKSTETQYDGEFSSHRKHGQGVERTPRENYKGTFVQGTREGYGILTNLTTKVTYEGNFNGGQRHGLGKEFDPKTNITYEGKFYENKQVFVTTMAKCEVNDDDTIEIGQNLMLPNFTFKILGKHYSVVDEEEEEEEEEGEEEAVDELSALEYISCEDRVHSSRTNFLMDVESGRRFVLEIGDFEVDSKEEEEDSKRREE